MGNLFKKKQKANKLLDEDYDNEPNANFYLCCSPCIFTNFKKNEWKKHFKEQCALLKKYNVFWAYFLPSLLNEFSSNISQEFFQSELFFPQNLQLVDGRLFIAATTSINYRSSPSSRPELSINKLYASSDQEIEEIEEKTMEKKILNEKNDEYIDKEQIKFEIYDADSLAKGIFNVEERDSNGNKKLHLVPSYSNNLLLSKEWDQYLPGNEIEIQNSLKYYEWATFVIEKHISNESSILCFLKCSFMRLFSERYANKTEALKGRISKKEEFEEIHSDSVHELLQFIRVLQESLALYYDLETIGSRFSKFCLFTKDNLKNFTTSLILNDEFYYLIFALHKIMYHSHAKKFRKNFSVFKKYDPEKFGLNLALCLNENTIEYFKQQNYEFHMNDKNLQNEENNNYFRSFNENNEELSHKTKEINEEFRSKSDLSLDESKYLSPKNKAKVNFRLPESFIDIKQIKPYHSAIETFKNIIFYKSPIHKLKIILKTLEKIEKSIQKFYEKIGIDYKKELTGDEIVTIFLYVVSKCNIPNLYAHLKFIDNFATPNVLNSKAGYYNATLQICVSHLEDCDVGNDEVLDEEKKESVFSESIKSCIEEVSRKAHRV